MELEEKIEKALQLASLKLPSRPKVVGIEHEFYEELSSSSSSSSEEYEALWVWVLLDERTPDRDRKWRLLEPIDREIRDALLAAGVRQFPYIDYVKPSERQESVAG